MSILNYFFIGTGFTFIVDLLLSMEGIKNHPSMENQKFGWLERIACCLVWPLAILMFLTAFIKQAFRK